MADLYVRAFLVAKDQLCYDKAVASLSEKAASVVSSDSTKAYAVCLRNNPQVGALPSNESPLTILIIARSSNGDLRSILDTIPNGQLFKTMSIITSNPETSFTRDEKLAQIRDPYIITASFLYERGKASDAIAGWRDFVDYTERHEEEAYTYAVFQSLDSLATLEVYSNPDFVANVHLKSPAIQANNAQNGTWRVPHQTFATKWHLVAGFLYRS